MQNKSGIHPSGNRILIAQESVIDKQESLIEIPEWVEQRAEQSQVVGILVEIGPDAFKHSVTTRRNSIGAVTEVSEVGYSEPFASVGDRVLFAKYSGLRFPSIDGQTYVLMNDEDITARVDENFDVGVLDPRKRAGRTKDD